MSIIEGGDLFQAASDGHDRIALRKRLFALYDALHTHFGHEPHWWPIITDTPELEVMLGAVLVQQTRWEAVEAAIVRLRSAGLLSITALAAVEVSHLAQLIAPCAFYNQKAPGIQTICRAVVERYGGDMVAMMRQERMALRAELLALPRVGFETADTMMLYAGGHPVFIVDAYTRRLFGRLDLVPGFDFERASYGAIQALVEQALTLDMPIEHSMSFRYAHLDGSLRHFLWDLHALITEACIHHCLARHPRHDQGGAHRRFVDPRKCAGHCVACQGCPLRMMCGLYQSRLVSA